MENTVMWTEIKSQLAHEIEPDTFQEIFSHIDTIYEIKNNFIYLIVANDFIKRRVEMLYLKKMNRMLESKVQDKHEFRLITEAQVSEKIKSQSDYEESADEYTSTQSNLIPGYTFDNFVIGNSNRLSYTSAIKVADQPGIVA